MAQLGLKAQLGDLVAHLGDCQFAAPGWYLESAQPSYFSCGCRQNIQNTKKIHNQARYTIKML